jgi:acetyl-CoA carboxylase carboxyltransferase component
LLLGLYPWYRSLSRDLRLGHLTGIIANAQPVIFVPEANKTTQFIRLCNASNIPIIYLHNVTGFMVGAKTESQGLIKAGAQLVNAVSNSKVLSRYG